jgi:hypothetical protein
MIIFIKDDDLATENKNDLNQDTIDNLMNSGYSEVLIPDTIVEIWKLKLSNFKKINGEWKFIVQELINELEEELAELD